MDNISMGNPAGNLPESEVHAAYDRMAQSVPPATLAEGLTHAFNSEQTPPFEQMVANLFAHSTPEQKSGLLNQLIGALGPDGVKQALGGGAAPAANALTGGMVTPEQAQQITPPVVQTLAQRAASKDPTVIQRAAGFYSEHPTLVKAVGVGALALLVSRMTSMRR